MAKELITRIWCDKCALNDVHSEARAFTVNLGAKTHEVDLCETCEKELIEPLRALIEEQGQPVTKGSGKSAGTGSAKAKANVCAECGKAYATRKGLRNHMRDIHDIVLDPPSGDYKCPICGKEARAIQGLAIHLRRAHDKSLEDIQS